MLSIDLAHEYVKLGKTAKANTIYGQTLSVVRNNEPAAEVRTLFLLHYSESLALMNNVLRRWDEPQINAGEANIRLALPYTARP